MTGRPGEPEQPGEQLRWPRGSEDEDFEAARATQHDALARWQWQQKARQLADQLGLPPPPQQDPGPQAAEPWVSPVLPRWWFMISQPSPRCSLCQRPVSPDEDQRPHPWPGQAWCCEDCAEAQQDHPAPASMARHWSGLTDQRRRLALASAFQTDPWSGRRVRIRTEHSHASPDGQLTVTQRGPWLEAVPWCSWGPGTGG